MTTDQMPQLLSLARDHLAAAKVSSGLIERIDRHFEELAREETPAPHNGSTTSRMAAVTIRTGESRQRVLSFLDAADRPLTDEQISTNMGMSRSGTSTRRLELVRAGLCRYVDDDGMTHSGHAAKRWEITNAGRRALDAAARKGEHPGKVK